MNHFYKDYIFEFEPPLELEFSRLDDALLYELDHKWMDDEDKPKGWALREFVHGELERLSQHHDAPDSMARELGILTSRHVIVVSLM